MTTNETGKDPKRKTEYVKEDDDNLNQLHNAVIEAELILQERQIQVEEERKSWVNLPLLEPGRYSHDVTKHGFRMESKYSVYYRLEGADTVFLIWHEPWNKEKEVKLLQKNSTDKIVTMFPRFNLGISWIYFDFALRSPSGLSLEECIVHFGIGKWCCEKKGLKCMYVYLTEEKSRKPEKSFILAMQQINNDREVLVKGNESREFCTRISRSDVPSGLQTVITTFELQQLRKGSLQKFWTFLS